MSHGVLYSDAISYPTSPLSSRVVPLPYAYYVFSVAATTTPATVYEDGFLATPYPPQAVTGYSVVTADAAGRFPGIFLDTEVLYRVQMFSQYNQLLLDVDYYAPFLTTFGVTALDINPVTRQLTITQRGASSGAALTVVANAGGIALATGNNTPTDELNISNTSLTGSQTANFTATNKPGASTAGPAGWMPIDSSGVTYYLPLWT